MLNGIEMNIFAILLFTILAGIAIIYALGASAQLMKENSKCKCDKPTPGNCRSINGGFYCDNCGKDLSE